ncbi:hypothetical protein ACFL6X_06735 [Candidatus Latescibacterota bacterium]
MGKVVIALEEQDLIDLHAALLDEDEGAALEFLKTRIAPRVPDMGTAPCDSTTRNPYLFRPEPSGPAGDESGGTGQ